MSVRIIYIYIIYLFTYILCGWAERAQVWAALLQRRYSHQNLFGLLRRPHEPYSVCSQLWRPAAPSRTRAQTQQHLTENQGQQQQQQRQSGFVLHYVTELTCLSEHMFFRLSFHVGAHLKPLFWLIPSSRCCRIWWVKRWRRMKASIHRGCSRTVKTLRSGSASNEMPALTSFY